MAAAQCRSSKCTAERKGFRRELDSWRHKLIHCIGFESILEGIYGPMLLRDLNIFDDCEPEDVDDWSVEASCSHCSFCNLPLDKLSDHGPAAASPLSSPSDYSPCQALTISDSSQSAHRFLQAVFHKKDVSLSCDSNIPLVAQELMKKMIHKFAIEYASKSHDHSPTNGLTTGNTSPLSDADDLDAPLDAPLDGPLDLTLSREKEKDGEPQPDGVLDLSKRNSACSATSLSANHKPSGFLLPTIKEEAVDPGRQQEKCGQVNGKSALEAVLNSLCPVHRSLLCQILKLAHRERLLSSSHCRPICPADSKCCNRSVTPQDNISQFPFYNCKSHSSSPHFPLANCDNQDHSNTPSHQADSQYNCCGDRCPLGDCKSKASEGSGCCCVQNCRVTAYPVFCLKNLHGICQSLAVHQINNVVCPFSSAPSLSSSSPMCSASSICYSHHSRPHPCLCYSNQAYFAQIGHTGEKGGENGDLPFPFLKREQSPSPPPLSPIPSAVSTETEEKPPCLLLHTQEDDHDLFLPLIGKDGVMHVKQQEVDFDTTRGVYFSQEELEGTPGGCCTENNPSGSLLKVVVDRFTEKLETIRPQDKDPPPRSTAIDSIEKEGSQTSATNQNTQFHADAHLREIITTVLHTGCDSDYNLSELFNQHDNSEAKSPNTRARRLQEVRAAMTTSLDHPSNRRHTLQIKRELAMLDPSYCRKRVPQAKKLRLKDGSKLTPPASSSSSDTTPVKEESQSGTKIQEELEEFKRKGVSSIHEEIIMKRMIDGEESTTEVERTTARGCRKISEDPNMDKGVEVFERAREEVCNLLNEEGGRGKVKEEIQAIIVTEEIEAVKVEERETKMAIEEKERNAPSTRELELLSNSCEINLMENGLSNSGDLEKGADGNHKGFRGRTKTSALFQSSNSREATRSKRNIVPPQRFSSYVTEPRKMYFVACFSESIFNPRTSKGDLSNSSSLNDFSKSPDVMDTQVESEKEKSFSKDIMGEHIQSTPKHQTGPLNTESKDQNRVSPMTMTAVKKSPSKPSSKNRTDVRDSAARPYGRLRSSAKLQNSDFATTYHTPPNRSKSCASISNISSNCLLSPSDCSFQYNSPIKLMYVSPVTDQEGVKYSLKSATSDSRGQVVEQFDPYEESSWAGTPEKNTSPGSECATSPVKSVSSPPKFTISSPKSTSTVHKSDSSPPKSASSSPKVASRRSRESSPSKRIAGTENQRSPGDVVQFHETTPTKRRPGRPKKLGPQMEKKIKRPIGRPRKQKVPDSIKGANAEKVKAVIGANREKENKNLKITVVYGRSRRNKRVVSEGHGQTELNDTAEAADGNIDLNYVLQDTQEASDDVKATLTERSEELNLVRPVKDKESTPHSSSNIKCQKLQGALAVRKPGRPAKVKISGISVTVTTVSPRQRKIQMNRDVKQSPEALRKKKALLPEFKSAKEPWTINLKTSNEYSKMERLGAKDERRGKERPLAVRHSVRIRKPSIYLLHSVATSSTRPYSHSTALLRSSRQLLLNKAINQRKQEKAQGYVDGTKDKRQLLEQEKNHICQDLSQLAGVSVDSIFPHKETLKWWAASAEENHLNQELARRIRVISDTWVSNVVDNREESSVKQRAGSFSQKSRPSSVVRALFDCPPNKPSSCSMQQICSWFMQTTETQSLAIVKKTSSRNPYELMHYPRSANKSSVCPSPQAERLHKHIKKFAKAVPKSPSEHRRAQDRLSKRDKAGHIKRQLFPNKFAPGRFTQGTRWWRVFSKYSTTLLRAKVRFLTLKERDKWPKRQWKNLWRSKRLFDACGLNGYVVAAPQQSDNLLSRSSPDQSSDYLENDSTAVSAERLDMHKEDRLSCKAWSPEKLKECRVFLKKINSPDSESTAEEWDSCTVTLDDWSPSAYRFAGRERAPAREDKAVKTERKKKSRKRDASGGVVGCALASPQDQDKVPPQRHKRKLKCSGMASSEPPKPPSVKMLRQSRMRGLSGPRWSDFVFEN